MEAFFHVTRNRTPYLWAHIPERVLSKGDCVEYGYSEVMMFSTRNPVSVFKSGLVVSMASPFLAASPDGKVIDRGCSKPFGLVEVKCPYTKFHVSSLEACADGTFFCRKCKWKAKAEKGASVLLSDTGSTRYYRSKLV